MSDWGLGSMTCTTTFVVKKMEPKPGKIEAIFKHASMRYSRYMLANNNKQ
jgi:hypothetical protein